MFMTTKKDNRLTLYKVMKGQLIVIMFLASCSAQVTMYDAKTGMITDESLYTWVENQKTLDSVKRYYEKFPNGKYIKQIKQIEEYVHLQEAIQTNTINSISRFIGQYPDSIYILKAKNHQEDLLFERARKQKILARYEMYLAQFPEGRYAEEIRDLQEEYYFNNVKKNPEVFGPEYLRRYPNGKYTNKVDKMMESF